MNTILDTIAEYARYRTEEAKKKIPLQELRRMAETAAAGKAAAAGAFPFAENLRQEDITFICECKKASPSKGLIAQDFPYVEIAKEYEAAGAGAVSVLTEPKWFLGSNRYLEEIAGSVSIPCLRKDFTVDEYMIYEAKVLGASAVLLICAITETARLEEYIKVAESLGLSALVEAHDEREIEAALEAGAEIIGVNNRNLKDFTVDIRNSGRLRRLVPKEVLFVAESGIRTVQDIDLLRKAEVNGVLIGESLMTAPDKKAMLAALRGGTADGKKADGKEGDGKEAGEGRRISDGEN